MLETDVDYKGYFAVAYSETTGRDVYGGRGWNGKSQTKGSEAWWNRNFVSVPSTIAIIITTSSTVSITTIFTTIVTSITATEPTFFGWYLRRMSLWGD
jgi:hypothetical protein